MEFEYSSGKIFYTDCGKGEAIIFLHGWQSSLEVFSMQIKKLESSNRCIAIDFAGFGKSQVPKCKQSIKDQADMVLSLCNFLQIKKFHIISHSYGGRVSIRLLSENPYRVGKSILIAPAGVPPKRSVKKTAKKLIFKLKKALTKAKDKEKLKKYYSEDYNNCSGVMRETFCEAIKTDQTKELDSIFQRVLIVRGDSDTAVSAHMVSKMERGMKNAKVCTIKGDHFAFLQDKTAFSLLCECFFES